MGETDKKKYTLEELNESAKNDPELKKLLQECKERGSRDESNETCNKCGKKRGVITMAELGKAPKNCPQVEIWGRETSSVVKGISRFQLKSMAEITNTLRGLNLRGITEGMRVLGEMDSNAMNTSRPMELPMKAFGDTSKMRALEEATKTNSQLKEMLDVIRELGNRQDETNRENSERARKQVVINVVQMIATVLALIIAIAALIVGIIAIWPRLQEWIPV